MINCPAKQPRRGARGAEHKPRKLKVKPQASKPKPGAAEPRRTEARAIDAVEAARRAPAAEAGRQKHASTISGRRPEIAPAEETGQGNGSRSASASDRSPTIHSTAHNAGGNRIRIQAVAGHKPHERLTGTTSACRITTRMKAPSAMSLCTTNRSRPSRSRIPRRSAQLESRPGLGFLLGAGLITVTVCRGRPRPAVWPKKWRMLFPLGG